MLKKITPLLQKKYFVLTAVLTGLAIGCWLHTKPNLKPEMVSVVDSVPLTSFIPNFQVASMHQPLEIIQLRLADMAFYNEEEFDDSLVLLDKVVVIPKGLQPQPRHRLTG